MVARGALLGAALAPVATRAQDAGAADVVEARPAETAAPAALRVDYLAPSGCPTAADFSALVCGRAAWACEALGPRLRVEIRESMGGASGQLSVERDDEKTDVRTLHGRTCADVVEALALTAALSLIPFAPAAPAPPPVAAPPSQVPAPPPTPRGTRGGARLGVIAGAARVVSPGVMPLAGVVAEVEASRGWLPRLRASLYGASNALAADRAATFSLLAVELEGCPVALRAARTVLAPCAVIAGGALRGAGRGQPTVFTETRAWGAAGAGVHVRVELGPRGALDLDAGGLVPFRQRDFVLEDPARTLARTASVAWRASLGASWALP